MSTIFKTSRKEARINNDLYYFTGIPCKYNHLSKRFVSCGVCVDCANEQRKNNRDKEVIRVTKYNKNNLDKMRTRQLKYRATNKGRIVANISSATRRAAKLKRTPVWLSENDKREIELIYKIADRVSKETGIKHHVDHEIPLQGEFVSGLHVPNNLQLLTAFDNLSKGFKYEQL